MKKWTIVAYPDEEMRGRMPKKEKEITAETHEEAIKKARREFPEYHEVGAYEIEDSRKNIGDSVKLKSGKTGIIEEYDEKHYYVRDYYGNLIKVKRACDSDPEREKAYLKGYEELKKGAKYVCVGHEDNKKITWYNEPKNFSTQDELSEYETTFRKSLKGKQAVTLITFSSGDITKIETYLKRRNLIKDSDGEYMFNLFGEYVDPEKYVIDKGYEYTKTEEDGVVTLKVFAPGDFKIFNRETDEFDNSEIRRLEAATAKLWDEISEVFKDDETIKINGGYDGSADPSSVIIKYKNETPTTDCKDSTYEREELTALEKSVYDMLGNNDIYPEDGTFNEENNMLVLSLLIDGDWKHDHRFCDHLVNKWCEENHYTISSSDTEITEEDGSDWYTAWHYYILSKRA